MVKILSITKNSLIGKSFVFCILASACAPLAPSVGAIQIYTPYVVVLPLFILVVCAWMVHTPRITLSKLALAYVLCPILMLLFSFWGYNISGQLDATLPYIFGAAIFLVVVLLQRYFRLNFNSVIAFAYCFLLVESFVVIVQVLSGTDFGVPSTYLGSGKQIATTWNGAIRASGTFGNPNVFSQVYELMSAIVVADLLFSSNARRMLFGLAVVLVTGLIIALSLSRSGMLFFFATNLLIVYRFLRRRDSLKNKSLIVVTVIMLVVVLAFPVINELRLTVADRLLTYKDSTRIQMYSNALQLASMPSVWFSGVGAGQFFVGAEKHGLNVSFHTWTAVEKLNTSVHNLTLKVLVESGVIVFMLYFTAVIGFIRRALKRNGCLGFRMRMMIGFPLLALFGIPLQLGTSGATIWIISFISVYFAFIENAWYEDRRQRKNHLYADYWPRERRAESSTFSTR